MTKQADHANLLGMSAIGCLLPCASSDTDHQRCPLTKVAMAIEIGILTASGRSLTDCHALTSRYDETTDV